MSTDPLSSLLSSGQQTTVDKLVSMYISLEQQPLNQLKSQKDQLTVQSAMFNDLSSEMNTVLSDAQSLSSSTDSVFGAHTATSSDSTRLTATASSSAANGNYTISGVTLATTNRLQTGWLNSSWSMNTGASGVSFTVNGALISFAANTTIGLSDIANAINNATYASGEGVSATIISNTNNGVAQNDLVLEGTSTGANYNLALADLTGTTLSSIGLLTSTTSTQVVPTGATDSSDDGTHTAGLAIDGTTGDASSWHGADGQSSWSLTMNLGSSQTVSRMVWSRDQTGAMTDRTPENYTIEYSNDGGTTWQTADTVTNNTLTAGATKTDTFAPVTANMVRITVTGTNDGNAPAIDDVKLYNDAGTVNSSSVLQAAQDATFSVNGVQISRSSNTGLTDVINGVTLNLQGDWTGVSGVTLQVAADTTTITSKITSFLNDLNSLTDYLKTKSAATKDATTGNYTFGPLTGYTLYTSLESSLASDLSNPVSGVPAGAPSFLSSLGIQMDSSGHFTITDSTQLADMLTSDPSGVQAYFSGADGIATRVANRLSPYVQFQSTGTESYISQEQDSITSMQSSLDDRITSMNDHLSQREATLRQQFTALESLLLTATQQQQQLDSIFSATSSVSS